MAGQYWDSLSSLEKAINRYRYTGSWRSIGRFSDTDLGHEALRFRMQQLARLTPREIVETVGKEKWKLKTITALEGVIRSIRESLSGEGWKPLLNHLQENLGIAKNAVETPQAYRKNRFEYEINNDLRDAYYDLPDDWRAAYEKRDNLMLRGMSSAESLTVSGLGKKLSLLPGNSPLWDTIKPIEQLQKERNEAQTETKSGITEAFPAAYRKPKKGEQPEFLLPPVRQVQKEAAAPGAEDVPQVPRGIPEGMAIPQSELRQPGLPLSGVSSEAASPWKAVNPSIIQSTAQHHFSDALKKGQAPDFDEFRNTLQGQYGPIAREKLWHVWHDGMIQALMNASGDQLSKTLGKLGLTKEVAKAMDPGMSDPYLGKIGDPAGLVQREFAEKYGVEIQPTTRLRQMQAKLSKQVEQRRRLAAISEIIDALTKQAGEKPKVPWERTEIGPEDIMQQYVVDKPSSEVEGEAEMTQPEVRTSPMIRTFSPGEAKDPKIVGDAATKNASVFKGGPARTVTRNVIALQDASGKVALVSTWRDPQSQTPRVTDPTVKTAPSRKIDANLLREWTPLTVMTLAEPVKGFRKMFHNEQDFHKWFGDVGIEGTPGIRSSMFAGPEAGATEAQAGIRTGGRPAVPEEGITFKPEDFPDTSTELTAETGKIAPGRVLYRSPRPEPPPGGERLTGAERLAVRAQAEGRFPYRPTKFSPSEELEKRGISLPPPGFGESAPEAFNKKFLSDMDEAWKTLITRNASKRDMYALMDGADRMSDHQTVTDRAGIITKSFIGLDSNKKADQAIAQKRRQSAIAYIALGGKHNLLSVLHKDLDRAWSRATIAESDPDARVRKEAAKDKAYITKLREGLAYADAHWTDPGFVQTAKAASESLARILKLEEAAGKTITSHENYIPGLFDGDFFDPSKTIFRAGRKLLGQQYRMPKTFDNPYKAIAGGAYRLASTDIADLTAHRLRQGYRWIEQDRWYDAIKGIHDWASGKPVAMSAIPTFKDVVDPVTGLKSRQLVGYKSPAPGYEVLKDKPIAVLSPYKLSVQWATARSAIDQLPLGRAALAYNDILKHQFILLFDTFHPGRLGQYQTALVGYRKLGFKAGASALNFDPKDMPEAVKSGLITQEQADWATKPINVGGFMVTRQKILQRAIQYGFNAQKFTDALYREALLSLPFIGEKWHNFVHPYNDAIFGRMIPGMMAEAVVERFTKAVEKYPGMDMKALLKDTVRDVNIIYGNMGRQGIFKNKTLLDFARLLFLAPMWQEGLIQKELRFGTRTIGAGLRSTGMETGYRKGLPPMGALGSTMAKGLMNYFVATQLINLISRHRLTFQNQEPEHKLDAWVPLPGTKAGGFWLSPLSVFAEMTHDIVRLFQAKDRKYDAVMQMIGNRAGPYGKMLMIAATGESPMHQRYATTGGILTGMAQQVAPIPGFGPSPIVASTPLRQLGHAIAPSLVSPNQPGQFARWAIASGSGIKTETPSAPITEIQKMANRFAEDQGLRKDTSWHFEQTDQPSYSKMRVALNNDDLKQARSFYKSLLKTHTPDDIEKAMKIWSARPWTGSHTGDELFLQSLTDKQKEMLGDAEQKRMEIMQKFYELMSQPD
jgi:hypothetical protein